METTINYIAETAKTKGRMVYKYHPLHNYRKSDGTIEDLDTEDLKFSIKNPVDIICLDSYDGSVNLIFNDDTNIPRLINTRFSTRLNNTFEIVDRIGNNDTNIYDEELFDLDTSLYKSNQSIPKVKFLGVQSGGSLQVGSYVFYFKLSDADDNETDFIAESGVVACFIGSDTYPSSINGGYKNLNSNKSVKFTLTRLDQSYDYVRVYYSRATSDYDQNRYTTARKLLFKYPIFNLQCDILITGTEEYEETTLADLNVRYFIANKAKTQIPCQNRLFLGNLEKYQCDYEDFSDLSLRIYPSIIKSDYSNLIGDLDLHYISTTDASYNGMYYNTKNIYAKVGYWDEEYYRFGIVYILPNGTLSPVFNIRGSYTPLSSTSNITTEAVISNNERNTIQIDEEDFSFYNGDDPIKYNSKGVIKIDTEAAITDIVGIQMNIPSDVVNYLQGKVQGFFFVRQKRIPTVLCQAYTLALDAVANIPMMYDGSQYFAESFLSQSDRKLNHNYAGHITKTSNRNAYAVTAICPEYDLKQAYFNQVFTGDSIAVKYSKSQNASKLTLDTAYPRLYYSNPTSTRSDSSIKMTNIVAVPDTSSVVVLKDIKFRTTLGEASSATKVRYLGLDNRHNNKATNLLRGLFNGYLGIISTEIEPEKYINIYAPGTESLTTSEIIKQRFTDLSEYMAMSERYSLDDLKTQFTRTSAKYYKVEYRGDCYINKVTHRLNYNFLDPSAPINDIIIEANTWKDNYDTDDVTKSSNINRGDVNAVQLGLWITLTVKASRNLGLRAEDLLYPSEQGMNGHARGFYPLLAISTDGNFKIPESGVLNDGFGSTLGERWNYTLPSSPYYKNIYLTRIAYSDITINDAFKNGYRLFNELNYVDYPTTYGGLMKLIESKGNLVAIFEHGIALIAVNERTQTANSDGGPVFINTNKVLNSTPVIISDLYGTLWPESVIKTPTGIYGVDTVAKKIWCITENGVACISDFKVQQFINNNISLTEDEMTPIIGIRNVKTHYNAFKKDIMFTFYDNTLGYEETCWNLCYNEVNQKFLTFYSWIPSYSENIDNIYFSFDRNTSKWISKLADSKNPYEGIGLSNVQIENQSWSATLSVYSEYANTENETFTYTLLEDPLGNKDYFTISKSTLSIASGKTLNDINNLVTVDRPVIYLNVKATSSESTYTKTIAVTLKSVVDNNTLIDETHAHLSTYFWKHGQSGILDIADPIKPCYWYGKQHPFEIEFVVNDAPSILKIFNNIQIISNNAEPESFHYSLIGDSYDFSSDKKNIYYRQEATKCLYQNLGSDIVYDRDYLKNTKSNSINYPEKNSRSTIFPLTYYRLDTIDNIEDSYNYINEVLTAWKKYGSNSRDYVHLSGTEITHDNTTNLFSFNIHSKAIDVKDPRYGRLRGNMNYKEDRFDIQINPIIFALKNETWTNSVPPIAIVGALPNDVITTSVTATGLGYISQLANSEIATVYTAEMIDTGTGWTSRKETKLRDKCIRIRIRYNGKKLAIIHAIQTLYTISYS